jgi:hypothetical protein
MAKIRQSSAYWPAIGPTSGHEKRANPGDATLLLNLQVVSNCIYSFKPPEMDRMLSINVSNAGSALICATSSKYLQIQN